MINMNPKAVIFARTSKKTQNVERQISDLLDVAKKENYDVIKIIEEKISGSVKNEKRKGISELLSFIETQRADIILTTEVSRLGRSPFETHKIVEALTQKNIPIYFHSYRITTLIANEKGELKRNPLAMILFHILSEFAYVEKEVLIERINSGLDEARRNGKKLGRKSGSTENRNDYLRKYSKLIPDIKAGISLKKCMKIHAVSKNTVIKIKKMLAA
jgi:DNA invertase Pin-like site-specific DNA recombinase